MEYPERVWSKNRLAGPVPGCTSALLANFDYSTALERILSSLAPGEPTSACLYVSLCGGDSNEWYPWQQVSTGRSPERRGVRKQGGKK